MRNVVVALSLAATMMGACERADMRVCKAMPADADGSLATLDQQLAAARAIEDPAESLQATTVARDGVWLACARRYGYILAKSAGTADTIAAAILEKCEVAKERLDTARRMQEVLAQAGRYVNFVDGEREEMMRLALALVVEARAGQCWLQPDGGSG